MDLNHKTLYPIQENKKRPNKMDSDCVYLNGIFYVNLPGIGIWPLSCAYYVSKCSFLQNPEVENEDKKNNSSSCCFYVHRFSIQIRGIFFVFLR